MAAGLLVKAEGKRCCLEVVLAGELDMSTMPLFERETTSARGQARHAVIDVGGLEFVDSSGIHAWLALAARLGDGVALVRASPFVRKLLSIAGVDSILHLHDSAGEAIRAFHAPPAAAVPSENNPG